MENIWVDIGADNKKEAEKRVSIGDPIVVDVECRKLDSDKIVSRATDDKAGAYVVAEVMKALSKRKLNVCVMGVATVQEEVGLRGAITSTYNVNPDAGFAIDVTFASDHPETDPKKTRRPSSSATAPSCTAAPTSTPSWKMCCSRSPSRKRSPIS